MLMSPLTKRSPSTRLCRGRPSAAAGGGLWHCDPLLASRDLAPSKRGSAEGSPLHSAGNDHPRGNGDSATPVHTRGDPASRAVLSEHSGCLVGPPCNPEGMALRTGLETAVLVAGRYVLQGTTCRGGCDWIVPLGAAGGGPLPPASRRRRGCFLAWLEALKWSRRSAADPFRLQPLAGWLPLLL